MVHVTLELPNLGNEIDEAQIDLWHNEVGDEVTEGDALVTITTPKVTMELEAPATGVLAKILAQEDDVVKVGAKLAHIEVN